MCILLLCSVVGGLGSLVGGIPNWFGCAVAFAPTLCPAGRKGKPPLPCYHPWGSERLFSIKLLLHPSSTAFTANLSSFPLHFPWGKIYSHFLLNSLGVLCQPLSLYLWREMMEFISDAGHKIIKPYLIQLKFKTFYNLTGKFPLEQSMLFRNRTST